MKGNPCTNSNFSGINQNLYGKLGISKINTALLRCKFLQDDSQFSQRSRQKNSNPQIPYLWKPTNSTFDSAECLVNLNPISDGPLSSRPIIPHGHQANTKAGESPLQWPIVSDVGSPVKLSVTHSLHRLIHECFPSGFNKEGLDWKLIFIMGQVNLYQITDLILFAGD